MKRLTVAVMALIGSGSAALAEDAGARSQYTLPAAAGLPVDQLARVVGIPGLKGRPAASFDALFDSDRKEIRKVKFPAISVVADELLLPPGKYYVAVNCNVYGEPAPGAFSLQVAAGQTYSLWCIPVMMNAPVVRISTQTHAQWQEKAAAAREGQAK